MHLIQSNKIKLLLCSLITLNLYGAYELDEEILSDPRKKTFDLNQKKANEDSSTLKKDWINPITYQYSKNFGEEYKTEKSVVTINQPIFQSGGIYQAIRYANSTHRYSTLEIEQQKKLLIKDAVKILFQIKKTELNIQKTRLTVKNADIDVIRKKEQVLNGFLDSSFLDNALLTLNTAKNSLVDLEYQRKELINNFHNISSKKYTEFSLPKLELFNEKEFLENNIEIKKAKADIQRKGNFSQMTVSRYLPSVNAFYNYTKNHFTDGQAGMDHEADQKFGLSINVPFDSRTFNEIESKKIDYLKSKIDLKNKVTDEKTFFKTKLDKIEMLKKRVEITRDDLKVYDSILSIIKEEKEAELKTQSDVDTLENSQRIKSIDINIYELDEQMELLEIYAKLH